MRTTVTIDDDLLRQARARALATASTLGGVVEDALRLLLAQHHAAISAEPVELPVYGASGLRPGVDLEDKDALADLLDEPAG
jgi:Bacterial antitoxin of type II TA system, VapB